MTDPAKTLALLKAHVAWGKEVDRNHLLDYHNVGEMIAEAEKRAGLLEHSCCAFPTCASSNSPPYLGERICGSCGKKCDNCPSSPMK